MIDKVIHYCWFGYNPKSDLINRCIESWKKYCPDYQIIEWNESNFDVNMFDYTRQAYKEKKYAFVSDVARLYVVYNYGGIYLDTDIELKDSLDNFLGYDGWFNWESNLFIATGLGFGAQKGNKLVKDMLEDYKDKKFYKKNGSIDLTPCPILQKVRSHTRNVLTACKCRVSGSLSLPSRGSFHLSLTVLYAIGH